jgi:hypothetical protein
MKFQRSCTHCTYWNWINDCKSTPFHILISTNISPWLTLHFPLLRALFNSSLILSVFPYVVFLWQTSISYNFIFQTIHVFDIHSNSNWTRISSICSSPSSLPKSFMFHFAVNHDKTYSPPFCGVSLHPLLHYQRCAISSHTSYLFTPLFWGKFIPSLQFQRWLHLHNNHFPSVHPSPWGSRCRKQ